MIFVLWELVGAVVTVVLVLRVRRVRRLVPSVLADCRKPHMVLPTLLVFLLMFTLWPVILYALITDRGDR